MTFLHAFGGVFSLLLVVGLGYVLGSRGWFAEPCRKLIPRLVTNVSLPPFLACTIITHFPNDNLAHMLYGMFPPFIVMGLLFMGAWLTAKMLKVEKRHFGLFCVCVSNPNTIFIGIPVNMALFGPGALPYVLLYYFASTTFFWTLGNYFISRDGRMDPGKNCARSWQKIISPPLIGFICGVGIILTDTKVPEFIFQAAHTTGLLTTPLALIFIGLTLQELGIKNLRPGRDCWLAAFGRMVASPALMMAVVPFFDLPVLMSEVYVIQSSLPVIMQVAILSAYYKADSDFGSVMVSLTTIICAGTVPILMTILRW